MSLKPKILRFSIFNLESMYVSISSKVINWTSLKICYFKSCCLITLKFHIWTVFYNVHILDVFQIMVREETLNITFSTSHKVVYNIWVFWDNYIVRYFILKLLIFFPVDASLFNFECGFASREWYSKEFAFFNRMLMNILIVLCNCHWHSIPVSWVFEIYRAVLKPFCFFYINKELLCVFSSKRYSV